MYGTLHYRTILDPVTFTDGRVISFFNNMTREIKKTSNGAFLCAMLHIQSSTQLFCVPLGYGIGRLLVAKKTIADGGATLRRGVRCIKA